MEPYYKDGRMKMGLDWKVEAAQPQHIDAIFIPAYPSTP